MRMGKSVERIPNFQASMSSRPDTAVKMIVTFFAFVMFSWRVRVFPETLHLRIHVFFDGRVIHILLS